MTLLEAAHAYLKRGFPVIPCKMITLEEFEAEKQRLVAAYAHVEDESKREKYIEKSIKKFIQKRAKVPKGKWRKYKTELPTEEELREWFADCDPRRTAIAIITGKISGITVIDIDHRDLFAEMKNRGIGNPLVSFTGRGAHLIYSYDPRLETTTNFHGIAGIDIRNDDGYIIAPPSSHYLGCYYRFVQNFEIFELSPPPAWMFAPPSKNTKKTTVLNESLSTDSKAANLARVRSALTFIPADDYDIWVMIGMALKNYFDEAGRQIYRDWSSKSEKYDPEEIDIKWESFKDDHHHPVTIGTIFHYAKEHGWTGQDQSSGDADTAETHTGAGRENISAVEIIRAADVEARPVQWIWVGWIAVGKLHILAGAPGTGKTTCAYNLAATITTGGLWPDGSRCTESGDVMIWSGEDSVADTIVPRLMAAGADLKRVHIIGGIKEGEGKRPFDPAKDFSALHPLIKLIKPKLLIVDSIVSAVSGDSHKNTETRRGLQPLVDLGEEYGVAILGISHFTKGTSGKDPLERVTGSLAFGALARIVLAAAKLDPGNKYGVERIFARVKSNIGRDGGGFGYSLSATCTEGIETVMVDWHGAIQGNARDLLAEVPDEGRRSVLIEAQAFLQAFLSDGPKPSGEVTRAAQAAGISIRTLNRAKKAIGVISAKGLAKGTWEWSLPTRNDGNLGNLGTATTGTTDNK